MILQKGGADNGKQPGSETEQEMYNALNPAVLVDECIMHNNSRQLISLVKQRQEKDNISVILIRTN